MWNEDKLLSYIADQAEESLTLDYKAAKALEKNDRARIQIAKDVSSFANSAGGIIIYGISEHKDASLQHLPERIDPIDRTQFSKEWLEHVISSIQPRLGDVIIHPVPLSSSANHCCYVVEIPPSSTAHQASDGRYYKRYNFESVRMSDYEIRDLMNRNQSPKVDAKMRLNAIDVWMREEGTFVIDLTNTGTKVAQDYLAVVEMPTAINGVNLWFDDSSELHTNPEGLSCWKFKLSRSLNGSPLFPEDTVRLTKKVRLGGRLEEKQTKRPVQSISEVTLKVYADNMKPLAKRVEGSGIWNSWH